MRIIHTADTHLGFDHPVSPRSSRRRRGPDFLCNFLQVCTHARTTRAHVFLHAGDLFDVGEPPPPVVDQAYAALVALAESGTHVAVIAGNHERAALPLSLLFQHPRLHVFHRAARWRVKTDAGTVAIHGSPYVRGGLDGAAWKTAPGRTADVEVCVLHQAVEGAVVGAHGFVFRPGPRVVAPRALPADVDVVACGHIHRHQVLWRDGERGTRVPVVYPGSIERTSIAERDEPKGFVELELEGTRRVLRHLPLPARPMVPVDLHGADRGAVEVELGDAVQRAPADAVLHLRGPAVDAGRVTAAMLRALVPPALSVHVAGAGRSREEAPAA